MKLVKVADGAAIELANSKIDETRQGFTDWLDGQPKDFKDWDIVILSHDQFGKIPQSLDSYKFNLLQNKQLFISQLKSNNLGSRTIDE